MTEREEFEKELNSYLKVRARQSIFNKIVQTVNPLNLLSPELEPYDKQGIAFPESKELHQPKKGMLTKLKEKLFGDSVDAVVGAEKDFAEAPMEKEDNTADFKEVSRIALLVMKKIPESELVEFKKTPEFMRFKAILKKQGFIK